jgi:hypothetical protein
MIKSEGDNIGRAKTMGVNAKENKKQEGKPFKKMQNVKMSQGKKRLCKQVAFMGAHKRKK